MKSVIFAFYIGLPVILCAIQLINLKRTNLLSVIRILLAANIIFSVFVTYVVISLINANTDNSFWVFYAVTVLLLITYIVKKRQIQKIEK